MYNNWKTLDTLADHPDIVESHLFGPAPGPEGGQNSFDEGRALREMRLFQQ